METTLVSEPLRVLFVEDLPTDTKLIARRLKRNGFAPDYLRVETREALQTALNSREWDVVITDYRLPDLLAPDVLAMLAQSCLDIPCLVVTGSVGEEVAVETMRAGAADIISKDNLTRLVPAIRRELREASGRRERRQAEQAVRQNEERFRIVAQATNDAVWDWNLVTDHVWWSENTATLFGHAPESINPHISWWEENLHEEDRERVLTSIRSMIAGSPQVWTAEYRFRRGDDGYADVLDRGYILHPGNGPPQRLIGAMMDITERKQNEELTRWHAYHDALTGLPNRALFQDRVEQELREARRHGHTLAVAFLDLDGFKHINDTLGHRAGDLLLKEVAVRLSGCLRAEDTIARQGGDEFTLLLPALPAASGPETVAPVADRLLRCFNTPFSVDDQEIFVTTSMGVGFAAADAQDVQTLLRHADTAMYRAKEQGRNQCQFYKEPANPPILARIHMESDLRRAIERGELELHYQPKLNLQTGEIFGVESLIRWRYPELGLILPGAFIPLAEETGLIVPLGEWVLREACGQSARWRQAGRNLMVTVNLSLRQFNHRELVPTIAALLTECGVEPGSIGLELTESVLMRNTEMGMAIMRELNRLGVRLALDDFGTGYSSLASLRDFPIVAVKMDRLFVAGLADNARNQAVVKAIVDLAHALDKFVVAEGVETQAQRDALKALNCDAIQGYLICPPLPAGELERFLDAHQLQAGPQNSQKT